MTNRIISKKEKLSFMTCIGFSVSFIINNGSLIIGNLISKFHIAEDVAWQMVSILAGSGSWIFSVLFPYFIPYIVTLNGLIGIIGVGATVGW